MTTPIPPNPSVSAPGHGGHTGHAPGPYRLQERLTASENHGGWSLWTATRWVADVSPLRDDNGDASAEGLATAHLFQAAPDLLAACERILPFLESWGRGSLFTADSIRTAVAKAHRGEAGSARGMG